MKNEIIQRPITPVEEFEIALNKAELSDEDYELIDYIRSVSYTHLTLPTSDLV